MEESIQEIPQGGMTVGEAIVVANSIEQSCIPPKIISRNQFGLIDNGSVQYKYNEEGFVDWRAMINPQFLVVNKQNFEKKSKQIPESIVGLEDRDLLILLGGIKTLAAIRGFHSVNYDIFSPSNDCVLAVCSISWLGNFETENRPVTFSAIGDANALNTNSFGKMFLGPIAENRAFVRAVRNFLKINIVGQEEIGPLSSESNTVDTASEKLALTMAETGVSWEQIHQKLVDEKVEGAEKFTKISDLPKVLQFSLITRLKKKASKKA